MTLQQGDRIHLAPGQASHQASSLSSRSGSDEPVYQVISVDLTHQRCWVRHWPLARHGSPVFEVSLSQVLDLHQLHPQTCQSRS
ncbi:hypothetical protein KQ302_04485 [Synechococcus sp. CS-602]|uniref:hypothetical protein n=1 Tax=Synechococcaceae TaxID=1890426 RepID=UPI0008FF6381|nr:MULTISPECIES: hypothetical protein [Synechococcaceae]MCT4365501.1 hypothetical protein [Candidatus Regnicoccus frigidus MAG-AL1]APD47473.1 hypothetical protein BM449_03235 [Synechococcus sp. SynAce01]MCT0202567.1 hypothetical protein [Synechococcus sp. CS-603]MCT0204371.1 hypothetical protein [Synechococcus sp. CS-602]MCT0247213.1 hypothetical protein [Synechococcus sp. CS-601]